MSSKSSQSGSGPETVTISVLGVSGTERVKGAVGVGKSLLCNRFIRGDYDSFQMEHSSILSQVWFCILFCNFYCIISIVQVIENSLIRYSIQQRFIISTIYVANRGDRNQLNGLFCCLNEYKYKNVLAYSQHQAMT